MNSRSILIDICDIVVDALPSHDQWALNASRSQFSKELAEIPSRERRNWLEHYACDAAFFWLHGIMDQTYKLDSCIQTHSRAAVNVAEQILLRTILEYYVKLCYLVDLIPEDNHFERAKRAIRLAYVDLLEYEGLPLRLRSLDPSERKIFLSEWYREIANGADLNRHLTRGMFEVIEEETAGRPWSVDKRGNRLNPMYESGYQIHSKIVHGNLWAIKRYGLTKVDSEVPGNTRLPGVDGKTKLSWASASGRILQNSYGLTMQFIGSKTPYTSTMNKINPHLDQIEQMILELRIL